MTLKEWHQSPALKEGLSQLVHGGTALTKAIEVMKEINRPMAIEYRTVSGEIDQTAHAVAHSVHLGYNQAIKDLEENLLKSTIKQTPITTKAYEYIKSAVHDLPTLIPTRK